MESANSQELEQDENTNNFNPKILSGTKQIISK